MTQEELNKVLELHKLWVRDKKEGVYADLRDANLEDADLRNANLRGANLVGATLRDAALLGANLRGANLEDADLVGADLVGVTLRGANLRGANLEDANLEDANLAGANLEGANLEDADFKYCIGNNNEVKSLQIGTYLVSYHNNILNIGCQSHTLEKWESFTNEEISTMEGGALEWWELNKDIILTLVRREN